MVYSQRGKATYRSTQAKEVGCEKIYVVYKGVCGEWANVTYLKKILRHSISHRLLRGQGGILKSSFVFAAIMLFDSMSQLIYNSMIQLRDNFMIC